MNATLLAPSAPLPAGTTQRVLERLVPAENPYFADPVGWHSERLNGFLWSKQVEIVESVRDNRYTAVHACHDVGKSYIMAALACWWLDVHPVGEAFVVTTAPTQPQVDAILWREIRGMHRKGKLRGEVTPKTAAWYMGEDELVAFGRKPADYADPEQAAAAFQGIHARYVLVILDEASGIPQWLFDAADSLVTNEDARVVAAGNPDNPTSSFAEICKPGSGWNVIHIDAYRSPNFTTERVPEWLRPMLISKTWVEERVIRWGERSARFVSRVRGLFPKVSDDTLITPAMIEAAQQLDLPGLAHGHYGGDVARFGDDETVVYRNRGGQVRLVDVASKQDTMETAGMFGAILGSHGPRRVPMTVDANGLGAGVYDRMRERELPVYPFNGAEKAIDSKRFANRRAEIYWMAREMLENGELDIDPADEQLAAELQRPKWHYDSRNRILIESKEDMRKRGFASPNRADAFVMSLIEPPAAVVMAKRGDRARTMTGDLLEKAM